MEKVEVAVAEVTDREDKVVVPEDRVPPMTALPELEMMELVKVPVTVGLEMVTLVKVVMSESVRETVEPGLSNCLALFD